MNEIWKPVKDFMGYEVSNLGRIRSFWLSFGKWSKIVNTEQRILKQIMSSSNGYPMVNLRRHPVLVHRLVLEAFVGPCPPGMESCHNDGIRTHNWLSNLRWDTQNNNYNDRRIHQTDNQGCRNGRSKISENDVLLIRKFYEDGYGQTQLGKMFNISNSAIRDIINVLTWKHI